MDKYEFNIKVEQIRKLVNKGDYGTAMKIADGIDWKKVRNANLLSMVAQVYEKNEEYQDAKDILLLAFERAPIGKRLLYKLTELSLKEGNVEEAEGYYREFCDLAGDDPRQQLLRYQILKQKNAPLAQLINSLESYTSEELDEKWLYELAELYHEAGDGDRCVAACDKIMLMFGLGKYVDKAMDLKIQYSPLSSYQMDLVENRDKYEAKLRAVEESYQGSERSRGGDMGPTVTVQRPSAPSQGAALAQRPSAPSQGTALTQRLPDSSEGATPAQRLSAPPMGAASVSRVRASGDSGEFPDYATRQEEAEYSSYEEPEAPVSLQEETRFQENYGSGEGYAPAPEGDYEEAGEYAPTLDGSYGAPGEYAPAPGGSYGAPGEYASASEGSYGAPEALQEGGAASAPYAPAQPAGTGVPVGTAYGHGGLETAVRQAETEATLAREMSRMAEQGMERTEEAADDLGKTRVLTAIRRAPRETQETGVGQAGGGGAAPDPTHLSGALPPERTPAPAEEPPVRNIGDYVLIEARMPERGIAMATAILKQIRRETGIRNPVAKTTGSKLNKIGIQASARKLAGKDLMIEEAGDLEPGTVEELQNRMATNQYGMRVVLLDNPKQLEMFCGKYPTFAAYFEYISSEDYQSGDDTAQPQETAARPQVSVHTVEPTYSATAGRPSAASSHAQGEARRHTEEQPEAPRSPVPETDDRPVRHIIPVRDGAMRAPDPLPEEPVPQEEMEEMDIDEFAQYACKYASDIDCSITGKSMLALYERIEIMEEDGIPLTQENAEALIEEAADRAEKPSLGRRIRNLFSSKYDKQGMLILKEEHFI